jgi:hypothetical protein
MKKLTKKIKYHFRTNEAKYCCNCLLQEYPYTKKIPNQLLFTPAPTQLASISVAMRTPELEASKN